MKMKKVMDRMLELETSQDRLFKELSEHQFHVIKGIIDNLVMYFKSEGTSQKFCTWSSFQVPEPQQTWEDTKSEVLKCISERARQFVQEWEDEQHHFSEAQNVLLKHCAEKYDIMEEEIRKVEEDVLSEEQAQESPICEPSKQSGSRKQLPKKPMDATAPVWFRQGLASVVLSTPFVDALGVKLKRNFQNKKKLERYKHDQLSYMKKKSLKCLRLITNEESLLPFITRQLEDAVQFLAEIKARIPRLREGDKKLYEELLTNSRSKFELQGIYEPVSSRLDALKRNTTVFNVNEMRKSDFSREELQWNQDDKSVVGKGSFSTVYSGVLSRGGQPEVKVALKVYNKPLTNYNVLNFIDEERALRLAFFDNKFSYSIHFMSRP